jgi:hypothetical protein
MNKLKYYFTMHNLFSLPQGIEIIGKPGGGPTQFKGGRGRSGGA